MDYEELNVDLNFEMSDIMIELAELEYESNIINSAKEISVSTEGVVINLIETTVKIVLKILEWIFDWIIKIWTRIKKIWNATIGRNKDAKFTIRDIEIRINEIMIGSENPLLKYRDQLISIENLNIIKNKFNTHDDFIYFNKDDYLNKSQNSDIVNALFECDKYVCLCDGIVRIIKNCQRNAKTDTINIRRMRSEDRQEKIDKLKICSEKMKDAIMLINNTNAAMLKFELKVYGVNKLHNHLESINEV